MINDFQKTTNIFNTSVEQNAEVIRPVVANTVNNTTELLSLGSKGQFLKKMQKADIPVPEFRCISSELLADIIALPINTDIIHPFFPELNLTNKSISVEEIINSWLACFGESSFEDTPLLKKIADFITSEDFYKQIKDSLPVQNIRQLYQQLIANNPNTAIIVRSSSTKEDCLGDAAAGKYESKVKDNNDIIITCLQVLASSFYQDSYSNKNPEPMGIILQKCINCSFGGVAMSHSTLSDNTVIVEYAPGQPKGAVSGLAGITPHCYQLKQDSNNQFVADFTLGSIDSFYELVETENAFTEIKTPITKNINQQPNKKQLSKLFAYIKKLEAIFMCPVDIEFAIDKTKGEVYILQVRPITKLNGGVSFNLEQPDNILVSGDVISEGMASGIIFYLDPKLNDQPDIPANSIVCTDYMQEWLLEPSVLAKVVAFVAKNAGKNDHIAISLRQEQKPFFVAVDNFNKLRDHLNKTATVVCGDFLNGSSGYLIAGDQQQLLTTKLKSSNNLPDVSKLPPARAKLSLTFDTVKDSFVWLSDANDTLLDFFIPDGLFHRCLSANNLTQLSMHPQRQEIYTRLVAEIDCFLDDMATFTAGFDKFIHFRVSNCLKVFLSFEGYDDYFYSVYYGGIDDLKNKLIDINNSVKLLLNKMVFNNLDNWHNAKYKTLDEWKADGEKLREVLRELNRVNTVDEICSIHDIIYFIHHFFVTVFPAMASGSGEGIHIKPTPQLNIINFGDPKLNILDENCIQALTFLSGNTCACALSLDNRSIIHIKENTHFAVVNIFDNSPANQGFKINLRFTDYLHDSSMVYNIQGRYKRTWFLAQLLKAINTTTGSSKMSVSYYSDFRSEEDDDLTCLKIDMVDFSNLKQLQQATAKLLVAFKFIEDINGTLNRLYIKTDNWDDQVLEKQLKHLTEADAYDEDFAISLFALSYIENREENIVKYLPWLNQQYKDAMTFGFNMRINEVDNVESLNDLLNNTTTDKTKQQQLLKYFAMTSPKRAMPLIFDKHPEMFKQ